MKMIKLNNKNFIKFLNCLLLDKSIGKLPLYFDVEGNTVSSRFILEANRAFLYYGVFNIINKDNTSFNFYIQDLTKFIKFLKDLPNELEIGFSKDKLMISSEGLKVEFNVPQPEFIKNIALKEDVIKAKEKYKDYPTYQLTKSQISTITKYAKLNTYDKINVLGLKNKLRFLLNTCVFDLDIVNVSSIDSIFPNILIEIFENLKGVDGCLLQFKESKSPIIISTTNENMELSYFLAPKTK